MALSLMHYSWSNRVEMILKKRLQRQRKRSQQVDLLTSMLQDDSMKSNTQKHIPEHLLVEILSRLPVKSVLQFKVVCKSWYAIIKSPLFISMHVQNYYRNNDDCRGCIITRYAVTQVGGPNIELLLVDNKSQRLLACGGMDTPCYNTYICGPCHGIYYSWCWYKGDEGRGLWNPTLREFKSMPPLIMKPNLPSHLTYNGIEFYGFGYDPIIEDYKVMVVKVNEDATKDYFNKRADHPFSVFIYSLRNDSWRYWGDMAKSYYLKQNICYVFFFNDSFYWLGSQEQYCYQNEVIISFNLATDDFELLMPLPDNDNSEPNYAEESIAPYYDSIAFLRFYEKTECFMMWTLNDGSWTKKCSTKIGDGWVFRVLGHWKDNKLLFRGPNSLIVYDPETQETWYLEHEIYGTNETISAYKESLVSVIDRKMWV